jgi:hypothetical protein
MQVAKVLNGTILDVADCRELCEWYPPSDENLRDRNLVRVSLFRDHDKLTQKLVACAPVLEGEFVYTVAVAPLTDEEVQAAKDSAMSQLRADRNQRLAACDWTQIADCTISNKAEWATYRQALRDFPATVSDARLPVTWPHDPNWVPMGV